MDHPRLVEVAGVTHVGRRRTTNEDTMAWDAALGFALVCDGVGGHSGGEVASQTAARSIQADLRLAARSGGLAGGSTRAGRESLAHELVRRAHQRVRLAAERNRGLAGMGTTLAMVLVSEEFVSVVHVGDSRVYRVREGVLERLTRDHFALAELVERGLIAVNDASTSGLRNVLSRALGMAGEIEPDVSHHALAAGDLFLLCSDGLTAAADDTDIAALVRTHAKTGLKEAAERAVDLANRRGGRDNVSVVLMRIQ